MTAVILTVIAAFLLPFFFVISASLSIQFAFNYSWKKTTFITCIRKNCQVHSNIYGCRCHFSFEEKKTQKEGRDEKNFNPFICHALIAHSKQQRNTKKIIQNKQNDRIANRNHSLDEMSWKKKIIIFQKPKWTWTYKPSIFPFCCLITDVCMTNMHPFSSLLLHRVGIAWEDEIKLNWKWKTRLTTILLLAYCCCNSFCKIEQFLLATKCKTKLLALKFSLYLFCPTCVYVCVIVSNIYDSSVVTFQTSSCRSKKDFWLKMKIKSAKIIN